MRRGLALLFLAVLAANCVAVSTTAEQIDWTDCLLCHSNQDSTLPRLADFRPAGLSTGLVDCATCHELEDVLVYRTNWTHDVLAMGNHLACTMCHPAVPHDADDPPPVPSGSYDVQGCFSCHRNIQAAQAFSGGHNALLLNCAECHPAHEPLRAQLPPLLVTSKVRREYSGAYDWYGSNQSCLACHPALSLAFQQREGFVTVNTENYHEVHSISGAALCVECHDPHGGTRPHLLRDTLLTGELFLYITKPGGGTCAVLCHGVDHDNWDYTNLLH